MAEEKRGYEVRWDGRKPEFYLTEPYYSWIAKVQRMAGWGRWVLASASLVTWLLPIGPLSLGALPLLALALASVTVRRLTIIRTEPARIGIRGGETQVRKTKEK